MVCILHCLHDTRYDMIIGQDLSEHPNSVSEGSEEKV